MVTKYSWFISLIYGLALLLVCPSISATTKKLIIRGSNNYPPLEYINENGEPEGFNVDMIRALMKELSYDYELKLDNWDKVVHDLEDKNIDLVIGMIYSKERATYIRFTLPTCVISRNFITRKTDNFQSIDDLKGKEIIAEKGGWFHQYLLDNNLAGKIVESDDIYQSINLLTEGKHDAVLASDLVAHYAIKQLNLKGLHIGDMRIEPQNYAMAVNQDHDELLYQLNIGLQRLKLSGAYDQIYNKWFGIYDSQKNRKPLLIALCVFLIIASLLILFVWLLRKQVAAATRMLNYSKQEVGIAIDAGNISAWTYIIRERIIKSLHGNSLGGIGRPIEKIYETIHPEDVESVGQEFNALATGEVKSTAISFRIHKEKDKAYRYVETKMVRVEATKEFPSHIVGTLKDITEDILMKEKLKNNQIKTDFIIKTNEIILIQYDIAKQTFNRIDEVESSVNLEYSLEEYLKLVNIEDIGIAKAFITNLNKAEYPKIEYEFRMINDQGVYHWYNITAVAYKYTEQGKISSYIGLRRNNTKWKQMNDDLIALREKAEASNRLKSAFLANMSHEIRTPLNAIVGFSELITEIDDKEEKVEFIEIVRKNNELLLQLINDVLDLSRIEAGFIEFNYATFDFSNYFQELYRSLKLKETRNVELRCVNSYAQLDICSDHNRISQVIINLVANAFKFTSAGSVTLSYLYENNGIKISVTDTGIGISSQNLERIFERFEKVNDFAQGTGLGLSICKVIVEALQGTIGVESELGAGSMFWFWVPCNIGTGDEQSKVMIKESISLTSKDTQRKKVVLIAEDIDNNYTIISTIVKDTYDIVIRAENGIDAVEKAKMYKPDIILMDMRMPLMNGIEATKEIRKFNENVPIIALTAYVFDTNKDDAIHAGCNDFLSKPVSRKLLMQALNNCK